MWRQLVNWVAKPRLRARLASFTMAATAAVLAVTAWSTVRSFSRQLLEQAQEASSTESEVLRAVLEEQMKAGDRALLSRVVSEIGQEPHIAWVGVLDTKGTVRVASDPKTVGQNVARSSADCQVCHAQAPDLRQRSVTLVRPGGGVLRTVTPLVNRPACFRCHGDYRRLNGVLIVDRSLAAVQKAVVLSRDKVLGGTVAALVVLLGSLGLAIEWLVLRRLRWLRLAQRELGRGNLAARAMDKSGDELGDLARDFNAMAERLEGAMAGLAAERRQLDELVNGIDDGVVLVDPQLRLLTTNRAFAARLGPPHRPAPGASYRELAAAAGFAGGGARTPAERALASGKLEKEIIRLGERIQEVYAQPLRAPDGQVHAVIEVWRDITDRMELEAGLEQSERLAALGVLASGIAHEVGNPLASIATAVEGLLRRMDEPAGADATELREYLEIVRKQVFRCRGVTERLLGFARLPSHLLTTIDAAAAAREVLALVAHQARSQGVILHASLDGPALVVAEELLLEQVFLNLVLNALQAMPRGGDLTLEARREAQAVCVVVSDTGPGIPDAVRRHLFEPLRRAGAHGGTGLGLFLSHTLLKRCGGALELRSEPGQGASFTVRLRAPEEQAT